MKTMLIADEDQRTKNIVRYTFELKGYKVVGAKSGADAILKIKEIKPDIALVDVSLSDKSGYEISKEIKNDLVLKNIPVILLAPLFLALDETELADACADALILKPFEFDEIIKKVEYLTTQKKDRALLPAIPRKERKTNYDTVTAVIILFSLLSIPILISHREDITDFNLASAKTTLTLYYSQLKHKLGKINPSWFRLKPVPAGAGEKGILVTVNDKKEIFINDKKYTPPELRFEIDGLINALGKKMEQEEIILKADATLPYGTVMEIADEIKKTGVKNVEFAVESISLSESLESKEVKAAGKVEIEATLPEEMKVSGEPSEAQSEKETFPEFVVVEEPQKNDAVALKTVKEKKKQIVKRPNSTSMTKKKPLRVSVEGGPTPEEIKTLLSEKSNDKTEIKRIEAEEGQPQMIEEEEKASEVVLLETKVEEKKELTIKDVYRLIEEVKKKIE